MVVLALVSISEPSLNSNKNDTTVFEQLWQMPAYEYVINNLYFTPVSVVHTLILTFASRDHSQGCPTLLGMEKCF